MNRKLRNTLGLIGLMVLLLLGGGLYIFAFQHGKINEKKNKLRDLESVNYNTDQLNSQLQELERKAIALDSVLAARKFNIPLNLSSIKFYNFVNVIGSGFSPNTQVDVEFIDQKKEKQFPYFEYKISGNGPYNDVYKLIYSIEQSKELKKIKSIVLTNQIATNKEGIPNFVVNFVANVDIYFSLDNRFTTNKFVENNLLTELKRDAFYPLIRTQISPNVDDLLDVQGAKLLALIPEGAFLADTRGNTYLLWEGEQVYLGYLTKIDYEHNTVGFILNKGGIIERVELGIDKEVNKKNQ
ncbi:MAG: hypothetical protein P4L27_04160 [Ignavibacteriaceae bacterium]|nr:hypothetical protein [Ignavibacteriaceae bacterium]